MVFVMKKSYVGNSKGAGRQHCLVGLGLTVMVGLHLLSMAWEFMLLTPEFESQGVTGVVNDTTYLDAVYFILVTLTTVGFGDIAPVENASKIFLTIFIPLSLVLTGVLLEATDFLFQYDVLEEDEEQMDHKGRHRFWSPARKKFAFSIIVVILLILAAACFFCFYEGWTGVNAIYFSVVTLSTVGYGDITPTTEPGRLYSIFWIVIGVIALFHCVGALMNLIFETRNKAWMDNRNKRSARVARLLTTKIGRIGMSNVSDTYAIKNCSKLDLVDALIQMQYVVCKLNRKGNVSLEKLRELNTAYKALTVGDIETEFSKKTTSMVFQALTGAETPDN